MGRAVLLRRGSGFYPDDYTAEAKDVAAGKKFLGRGSDTIQEGAMKNISKEDVELPVNGTYSIEPGYYSKSHKVFQDIQVEGAQTVTAVGNGQTVNTSGKYYTGDVTLTALENFDPVNIKRGVTVGEGPQAITGNYEGFE